MKSFLIITGGYRPSQKDALTRLVEGNSGDWWHWLEDVWLVLDPDQSHTTKWWRSRILETVGEVRGQALLIFQIPPGSPISGFTNPGAVEWFAEKWDPSIRPIKPKKDA